MSSNSREYCQVNRVDVFFIPFVCLERNICDCNNCKIIEVAERNYIRIDVLFTNKNNYTIRVINILN